VSGVLLGNIPSAVALTAVAIGQLRDTGAGLDPAELLAAVSRSSPLGSGPGLASAAAFWMIAGSRIAAASARSSTRGRDS